MICPSCGAENLEGNDRCENCLASFRNLDVPDVDKAEGLARHVMEDRLSRLDHEAPIIVAPETPAIDVARQMKDANSGCALVLDGTKLVGIFTEHDVLNRISDTLLTSVDESTTSHVADDIPFADMPSSDIPMEEMLADEKVMEETATVSTTPFGSALQVPVKELMSSNPETLRADQSIAFALNKMSIGRYRHIPIQKEDGSYGVASIKSVLKYIAQEDW
jgi:CBS domain-containing protein